MSTGNRRHVASCCRCRLSSLSDDVLIGAAAKEVTVKSGRPYNTATYNSPCVIHANGWEKQPLIDIVYATGEITQAQQEASMKLKFTLDQSKVWTS